MLQCMSVICRNPFFHAYANTFTHPPGTFSNPGEFQLNVINASGSNFSIEFTDHSKKHTWSGRQLHNLTKEDKDAEQGWCKVVVIRHPLDQIVSAFHHWVTDNSTTLQAYAERNLAGFIKKMNVQYQMYLLLNARYPRQYRISFYEDRVARPVVELGNLAAFFGLPLDLDQLHYVAASTTVQNSARKIKYVRNGRAWEFGRQGLPKSTIDMGFSLMKQLCPRPLLDYFDKACLKSR